MIKYGNAFYKQSNYNVILIQHDDGSIRLDLVSDFDMGYTIFNTEGADGSLLIKSKRIFIYNEDGPDAAEIYKELQRLKMLLAPEEKTTAFEDGKIVMTTHKRNPGTPDSYGNKLVNGKIVEESYTSSTLQCTFTEFDTGTVFLIEPSNINDYNEINLGFETSPQGTLQRAKGPSMAYTAEQLLRMYPQLAHVLRHDYKVIESLEEAKERFDEWVNSPEILKSVDIESLDKTWGPGSDNKITGIFLGYGTDWSTYFPILQDNCPYNLPHEWIKKIFDAVNNQPKETIILAHNAKFEIQGFMQELGYDQILRVDVDTYILAVLLNPVQQAGTHDLKSLGYKYTGNWFLPLKYIFSGPIQFNVLTPEVIKLYGCPDATTPAIIYTEMMKELPKTERFVLETEMQIVPLTAQQEFYGLPLDMELLSEQISEKYRQAEILLNLFKKLHKTSANINSAPVMQDILYNKLGCPCLVYTKKGAPATNKTAIEGCIKAGNIPKEKRKDPIEDVVDVNGKTLISGKDLVSNKYPTLLIYQKYKLIDKDARALLRLKNHSLLNNYKFYMNQCGAGSNRKTSDAHQFSDAMKMCVQADVGHELISSDWSQMELRLLAGVTQETELIAKESDPNCDIHRLCKSIISGMPMYLISEEDRKAAKSVNFGVVYGMTEYGMTSSRCGPDYTKADLEESRTNINDYMHTFQKIAQYIQDNYKFLDEHGYIETILGYRRPLPQLLEPTLSESDRSKLHKAGNNTTIQGLGAQCLKIAEITFRKICKEKGWDELRQYGDRTLPRVRIMLDIHDEMLISYDSEIPKEALIEALHIAMEEAVAIKGFPPLFASPAFINNWYDGKNDAYAIEPDFRAEILEKWKQGIPTFTPDIPYLDLLTKRRQSEITSYMNDLVSKYHTVDEVAKHVTDDNLTHTLIESMIPSKGDRKKLTHMERIHRAVELYMDANPVVIQYEEADSIDSAVAKENIESIVQFDDKGNFIDTYQEDEYFDTSDEADAEDMWNWRTKDDVPTENHLVLYTLNECLVDVTGKTRDEVDKIYSRLKMIHNPDEPYGVRFLIGSDMVPTEVRVNFRKDLQEYLFGGELVNGT